ncbi:Uncharacterised protein [Burkholderia pseudomallei]|nr:Uncharacterised protein [Burkholderia pseudomallei]
METLREGWTEYERGVIPEDISQPSREVLQHAFYSGAIALMVIGETYREHCASEADRLAVLERVVEEIIEFNARCEVKMLLHMLAGAMR